MLLRSRLSQLQPAGHRGRRRRHRPEADCPRLAPSRPRRGLRLRPARPGRARAAQARAHRRIPIPARQPQPARIGLQQQAATRPGTTSSRTSRARLPGSRRPLAAEETAAARGPARQFHPCAPERRWIRSRAWRRWSGGYMQLPARRRRRARYRPDLIRRRARWSMPTRSQWLRVLRRPREGREPWESPGRAVVLPVFTRGRRQYRAE